MSSETPSLDGDLEALRENSHEIGGRHSRQYDAAESRIRTTVRALQAERDLAVRERDALKAHHTKNWQAIGDVRHKVRALADSIGIEAIGCGWCDRVVGHTPDCKGVASGAMQREADDV